MMEVLRIILGTFIVALVFVVGGGWLLFSKLLTGFGPTEIRAVAAVFVYTWFVGSASAMLYRAYLIWRGSRRT